MEKRALHSPDLTARNVERIAQLFPHVITESRDAEGNVALRRFGGECGFRRGEWWVGVEVPEDQERPSFRIDSRGPRRVSRYGVR